MLVVTLDFENEILLTRKGADGTLENLGKVVLIRSGNSRIRIGLECPEEVQINRQTDPRRAETRASYAVTRDQWGKRARTFPPPRE